MFTLEQKDSIFGYIKKVIVLMINSSFVPVYYFHFHFLDFFLAHSASVEERLSKRCVVTLKNHLEMRDYNYKQQIYYSLW